MSKYAMQGEMHHVLKGERKITARKTHYLSRPVFLYGVKICREPPGKQKCRLNTMSSGVCAAYMLTK